eukprot:jgi/Ulvmu1/9353/UM050_0105.1
MARERLADLDESKEEERERKLKLQEKNRRAQQAFRWRQKSKIQELSDQVTELTAKNASNAQQMQELAQVKNALEDALRNQGSQLKRISTEYMVLRARSVSNVFLPSSTIQFDPSEDVILKYPASTTDGVSEHVIVPSSDIQQGIGMERIRELMQEQWLPELKELNEEYNDVLEKKRANSQGSSRTKQARQDEANKQLASIDERCKHLQGLYFECLVKIIRAQPVRARMLLTNVLYNCHAGLSPAEARDKAEAVADELHLTAAEEEQTCRMYEKYLCNMAVLRWQREKMGARLAAAYATSDEEWQVQATHEQSQLRAFLSASASVETLYTWLRKETELYCDLLTSVCLEIWRPTTFMRHMTASAPGIVDFLAILEVLRSRHKPQEKVLDLATAYVQTAITPRTMNAIAEGHMDASGLPGGPLDPSPRDAGLSRGGHMGAFGSGGLSGILNGGSLPSPGGALNAAREAEDVLRKAKAGGRGFWGGAEGADGLEDAVAAAGGAGPSQPAAKKAKLSLASAAAAGGGGSVAAGQAQLPKLERSQLLAMPQHAQQQQPLVSPRAGLNGVLGSAGPLAGLDAVASAPSAACHPAHLDTRAVQMPPLSLGNLHSNGNAPGDLGWLTHSLTPRDQDLNDFLSGMLSNRGGSQMPSPGRVSTIDILRVRSNSQVGEIELIRAQEHANQGAGLQVNSLHLSGANPQLNRLAQDAGLLGNLASVLPGHDELARMGGQGALAGTNSGADVSASAATQPLLLPSKLQLSGAPQPYVRRTPEELAKQYQEFMGEPI